MMISAQTIDRLEDEKSRAVGTHKQSETTFNSWNISETWLVFSGEEVAAFTKSCQEYRVLFKKNPFFAFETGPEARCVFFYRFMLLFYRFMLFLC